MLKKNQIKSQKKILLKILFNKQIIDVKEILELSKKYKESSAKTDKMIKELSAEIKDR